MAKRKTPSTLNCGIAQALDVVGDTWSLLILRDLFVGARRFDVLQKNLGIASNILTTRLRKLEAEGIVDRREFREVPPRVEYEPTQKARDLYPALLALKSWGDKWVMPAGHQSPFKYVHEACGHDVDIKAVCGHCGDALAPRTIRREVAGRS